MNQESTTPDLATQRLSNWKPFFNEPQRQLARLKAERARRSLREFVIQAWPVLEPELLVETTIALPVQVNGRKRAEVTVPRDASTAEIEAAVLALDAVKLALDGKAPKRVIVVPGRIVNVVV